VVKKEPHVTQAQLFSPGSTWKNPALPKKFNMVFDGHKLHWHGQHIVFRATSGLATPGQEGENYQAAKFEGLSDHGPIPEGWYRVPVAFKGLAKAIDNQGNLNDAEGVQVISPILKAPNGHFFQYSAWGTARVPLHKILLDEDAILKKIGIQGLRKARLRYGFYLHNSHKGYTHGCIEVDDSFFLKLRIFRDKHPKHPYLVLQVSYRDGDTKTYGGTWDGTTQAPQ
jgi:hypothetical protein